MVDNPPFEATDDKDQVTMKPHFLWTAIAVAAIAAPAFASPRDMLAMNDAPRAPRQASTPIEPNSPKNSLADLAWGEVWGLGAEEESVDFGAIQTASIPSMAPSEGWGEVWGLEPTAPMQDTAAIETASIPGASYGEVWAEVWGVGMAMDTAAIETASIKTSAPTEGWGEVWGIEPTTSAMGY